MACVARDGRDACDLHSLHGADAYQRRGHGRHAYPQGAVDAVIGYVGPTASSQEPLNALADRVAKSGGTPLAVSKNGAARDHPPEGYRQGGIGAFRGAAQDGHPHVMITGDNPLTRAAIAAESGVDDFLAQATPEAKLKLIREKGERQAGRDVRRRHQRCAGAGTGRCRRRDEHRHAAAREAATWSISQRSDQAHRGVEIGKQLLMTPGRLRLLHRNDVAKYFAILPDVSGLLSQLQALNVMRLHSPESAILSRSSSTRSSSWR